jgi:anti-sigma regulatory factor (Ser/Thr protein kinase)
VVTVTRRFRHAALFHAGEDQFAEATLPFLRDGIARQEPTLVVVDDRKIERLRTDLGRDADRVVFADMAKLGKNPARIIPAWQVFVDDHAADGRPLRGIGEPVWASRTPAERAECHAHESLLNVAFDDGPTWSLICPYDTSTLDEPTLNEARTTHRWVIEGGVDHPSAAFRPRSPFDGALSPRASDPDEMVFAYEDLVAVRRLVADRARAGSLGGRVSDLVLAVNELAVNSVRHGGGAGTLRIWRGEGELVCEVADAGRIDQPLIGRVRPSPDGIGGAGLWLVNHLCDLVQIRSGPTGTVVRVHMTTG